MKIWYDFVILIDENEKYIDLYPHINNPYTYELNRNEFVWEIEENPESLKFNESNGRVYGNVSYEDLFYVCLSYGYNYGCNISPIVSDINCYAGHILTLTRMIFGR